jgi:hypothetical protein
LPPYLTTRYTLCNFPREGGPDYGFRIDELFDTTGSLDKFSFDFEAPGCLVYFDFDGVSVRIWGIVFGGLEDGQGRDPTNSAYCFIDVTYPLVTQVPGDDDLKSDAGSGTLVWKVGTQDAQTFVLGSAVAAQSSPYAFRFGNKDGDSGFGGYGAFAGWGGLVVDGTDPLSGSEWQFVVCPPTSTVVVEETPAD